MIDWDEMPWNFLTEEEVAEFETALNEQVDWLLHGREAEQSLTGQEA